MCVCVCVREGGGGAGAERLVQFRLRVVPRLRVGRRPQQQPRGQRQHREEALLAHETLNFHPLRNDMTTAISREDFLSFATATGHTVTRVDFTKLGAA